jgi:hypothetical protein
MSEWISLKDQEPPKGKPVLITDGNDRVVAFLDGYYKDGTALWRLEGVGGYEVERDFEDKDITHWMALPELPGKEKP